MMDSKWPGTSAWIRFILPPIFILSLATWAVGIAFTVKSANEPLTDASYSRSREPSVALLYFYSCGLPMATTLAAAIDFFLYRKGSLFPVISVSWGTIAFCCWLNQIVWWTMCEQYLDGVSDACPHFYVYDSASFPSTDFFSSGSWYARLTMGAALGILALTQMGLGARAMDLKQKEKKRAEGPICGSRRESVLEGDQKRSAESEKLSDA